MRKAAANTLAHLLTAMLAGRSVTIRYEKPVKGGIEVSRRRIDIHSVEVSSKGSVILRTWDHRDQEISTFRLDRITHYTLHRSPKLAAYGLPTYAVDTVDVLDEDDGLTGVSAWGTYELTA